MHFDLNVKNHSSEVSKALENAKEKALEMIGLQVEGYAQLLAPVDTGRLRNSITHVVNDDSVVIGTNVEYAVYQEFGTSKTKAQPYLKPAVMDHINEYKSIAERAMKS
jgi:HK97 gp10 family phage protein